jgi:hypothetical protein
MAAMSARSLLRSRAVWLAAGALAAGGAVAYLVIGGTLWWYLGLAAVAPLAGLMLARLAQGRDTWPPISGSDGPWGAP